MEADQFLQNVDSSDLRIATEFLTTWLPFLTRDLCEGCAAVLHNRIRLLSSGKSDTEEIDGDVEGSEIDCRDCALDTTAKSEGYFRSSPNQCKHIEATGWNNNPAQESSEIEGDVEAPEVGDGYVGGFFGSSTQGYEHIVATGWDTDPAQESQGVEGDVGGSKFGSTEQDSNVGYFGASLKHYENIVPTGWDIDPAQGSPKVKGDVEVSEVGEEMRDCNASGNVDQYFSTSLNGYEHIEATGWDTDPAQESPKVNRDMNGFEVGAGEGASNVRGNAKRMFRSSAKGYGHIKETGWDADMPHESRKTERDRYGSKVDGEEWVSNAAVNSEGYFNPSMESHKHIEATGWDTNLAQGSPKAKGDVNGSKIGCGDGNTDVMGNFRASQSGYEHIVATGWDTDIAQELPNVRMSWADMSQESFLKEKEEDHVKWKNYNGGMDRKEEIEIKKTDLFMDQMEWKRFTNLGRKKDFVCLERIDGKIVNIMEGLELHTGVFSIEEQKRIVDFVYELQKQRRNNEMGGYTYYKHERKMPDKGPVKIQFGCCYTDVEENGTPEGILRDVVVDPMPNLFKDLIKRLIRWHVMPPFCVPDSCVVHIYEPGDYISPHIDSHDFVRPFCTASFVSECNMAFGSTTLRLPSGSVLVLKGKGADIAKHCIPAVSTKRISITFRKMERNKWPIGFRLDSNIRPYDDSRTRREPQKEYKEEEEPFVNISTTRGRKYNGRPKGRPDYDKSETFVNTYHRNSWTGKDHRYHRHGWMDDDDNKAYGERRVRMQQQRITVTRYLDDENDSTTSRSSSFESSQPQPHLCIQTSLKNNQRRVHMKQ